MEGAPKIEVTHTGMKPLARDHFAIARESEFRIIFRALWVARVSVAVVAFAFILFALVPQVQDLFIEIEPTGSQVLAHWGAFYIVAIMFWVLPIYLGARVTLQLN